VDANDIEPAILGFRLLEHTLEDGTSVIGGRGSGLDELLRDDPILGFTMSAGEIALRRYGDIPCSLSAGTHAQVKGSPFWADWRR
jgi:hypothetical protein